MDQSSPAPSRGREWGWALLLLAVTILAYGPAWSGQPLWDDAAHMTRPELRSVAGLASIWTRLGATQQYYPLLHSLFWLEYRLWGESTVGPHLVSILLHGLAALLLVRIVRKLELRGAWLAGGVFALHPVMVESVAWITELKNTLSAIFFLTAALAYLDFDGKRKAKPYALALTLFVLGLLSKSVIVTLPGSLLVVLWWKRGRVGWKRDVVPLLPFFVIGIVSGLFTAWVERRFIGAEGGQFSFGFVERCLIAGRAVWFYLYKLVWPADLVFIYPRWNIDSTAMWQYLFPAALVVVLLVFLRLRSCSRAPLAVLLYFAVTLFPALGFFNVYPFIYSFVADHFQYLASLGPIVAGVAGLAEGMARLQTRLRRPLKPLPALLSAPLLAALFTLSWQQSRMYSDAETLYRTTIARNSSCWMAYTHLGLLLMEKGRHDEALAQLSRALSLHPNQADAHNNLGLLYMDMGRTDDARAHLSRSLELNPNEADAHNNLGALLSRDGRRDAALPHLKRALELHPNHAEVHYNLGDLLAAEGRTDEAMVHYQRALEIDPGYADAHSNFGLLLAQLGRAEEAVAHFRKASELDPKHANAQNNLGVMLAKMGKPDEAIDHYRKAVEIDPLELGHLDNLVLALVKAGRWNDASAILDHALSLAKAAGDEPRARAIAQNLARLGQAIRASQTGSDTRVR